jgi:hypothetical protein
VCSQPTPLAYGAIFSQKPLESEEWIVEFAFRVHGAATVGLAETTEDGKVKRMHKVREDAVRNENRGMGELITVFCLGRPGIGFLVLEGEERRQLEMRARRARTHIIASTALRQEPSPGPVTISADPKAKLSPPPPPMPQTPSDPSDPNASLFGSRTKFDGLGVIFDTSPTQPLYRRSDSRNYATADQLYGVGNSGVVSGILDDGTGTWLESDARVLKGEDEAAYLEKAIGDCEASFR